MQHILTKRTISDKILKNKFYEISRHRSYNEHQRALAIMVYKFLDKKAGSGVGVNKQLAEELHKSVTKSNKKIPQKNLYARFKDNIWVADLAEEESFSSKDKNVKYLLCVIDVFNEYACVRSLNYEKGNTGTE